jgi:hypothetical protein
VRRRETSSPWCLTRPTLVQEASIRPRAFEADLVAHIAEVDARRLYAREAAPSMFAWCIETLHLSEAEAYLRIAVARASREHPMLLTMLKDGRLHLTGIAKLAPHLNLENRDRLLARAAHGTKREIEELIAEGPPRPDAPTVMKKLPERSAGPTSALRFGAPVEAPAVGRCPDDDRQLRPDGVGARAPQWPLGGDGSPAPGLRPNRVGPVAATSPLSPGRYRIQFTANADLRDKLDKLRALMRSSVPDGDLAAIIDAAVTEKLERLEARRFARTKAPREGASGTRKSPSSRHVPAAVRRAVYERDGGRCRFVDDQGRRCSAREGLEFHHRHPFALGGEHSAENMALLCHTHNGHLAEIDFGREAVAKRRRPVLAPLRRTVRPPDLFSI